jgi:hypothetical protein
MCRRCNKTLPLSRISANSDNVSAAAVGSGGIQLLRLFTNDSIPKGLRSRHTTEKDNSLQRRIKTATNLDIIVEIAEGYDYKFISAELQSFLEKMPNRDLAPAINPGIGNRSHLIPR